MHENEILNLLQRDLSETFAETFCDELRGEYSHSYEQIAVPPGGYVPHRRDGEWDALDLRAVRNRRRINGLRALQKTCIRHGAPFQVKSLPCNGQVIVIGQIGQLLILSEPIDSLGAKPERAAYKSELAASHFAIRQLEMDLGDGWRQRIDARNTMLVVLQHGMRVGAFNRRDTALEMLRLVVPDVSFQSWLFQANLMNGELAAAMEWTSIKPASGVRPTIPDNVVVKLKADAKTKDV